MLEWLVCVDGCSSGRIVCECGRWVLDSLLIIIHKLEATCGAKQTIEEEGGHHQSNSGDGVGLLRLFIASTLNLVLRFFESRMNERLRNSTH